MTIAELQIELAKYPPNAEVCVSGPNTNGDEEVLDIAEVDFIPRDGDETGFVLLKDANADVRDEAHYRAKTFGVA
jgi:hypothetical protein